MNAQNAEYLFYFLASIAFLSTVINGIKGVVEWIGGRGQKREITNSSLKMEATPELVSRQQLDAHLAPLTHRLTVLEHRSERVEALIPAMERHLTEKGEERAVAIHNRINDVLEAVSELRGEVHRKGDRQ